MDTHPYTMENGQEINRKWDITLSCSETKQRLDKFGFPKLSGTYLYERADVFDKI